MRDLIFRILAGLVFLLMLVPLIFGKLNLKPRELFLGGLILLGLGLYSIFGEVGFNWISNLFGINEKNENHKVNDSDK